MRFNPGSPSRIVSTPFTRAGFGRFQQDRAENAIMFGGNFMPSVGSDHPGARKIPPISFDFFQYFTRDPLKRYRRPAMFTKGIMLPISFVRRHRVLPEGYNFLERVPPARAGGPWAAVLEREAGSSPSRRLRPVSGTPVVGSEAREPSPCLSPPLPDSIIESCGTRS